MIPTVLTFKIVTGTNLFLSLFAIHLLREKDYEKAEMVVAVIFLVAFLSLAGLIGGIPVGRE